MNEAIDSDKSIHICVATDHSAGEMDFVPR